MRWLFVAALAVLSTACGSDSPDFTQPPTDFAFQIACENQVAGFPPMMVFEHEFDALQETIRASGPEQLTGYQRDLLDLLSASEATTFSDVSLVPQRVFSNYTPGETTIEELRESAGVREVQIYARVATRPLEDERQGDFIERYDDSLNGHCDSFFEEDIRAACEAGDGTSCFRVNRIERRDFDIIAEACELAPYMLLCEPEDPPPYDLPRINES